jgi:hypothetical protein
MQRQIVIVSVSIFQQIVKENCIALPRVNFESQTVLSTFCNAPPAVGLSMSFKYNNNVMKRDSGTPLTSSIKIDQ